MSAAVLATLPPHRRAAVIGLFDGLRTARPISNFVRVLTAKHSGTRVSLYLCLGSGADSGAACRFLVARTVLASMASGFFGMGYAPSRSLVLRQRSAASAAAAPPGRISSAVRPSVMATA